MKSQKILVTGGLGAVGSRYADRSARARNRIVVIDCGQDKRHDFTATRLVQSVREVSRSRVESLDWAPWLQIQDIDAIVHCAAHTGIPHSAEDPNDDWASNVDATRALLEGLRKTEKKIPMVALSSVKPYRTNIDGHAVDEETPLEPDEPYAATRQTCEAALSTRACTRSSQSRTRSTHRCP